jgi:hypothetical protein
MFANKARGFSARHYFCKITETKLAANPELATTLFRGVLAARTLRGADNREVDIYARRDLRSAL